jgi:integrase
MAGFGCNGRQTDFKSQMLGMASRVWQGLFGDTHQWRDFSVTGVLEIAVEKGILYDNPARGLPRSKVRQKNLQIPEPVQFEAFTHSIATAGGSSSRDCAALVSFLAFGGFRVGEAKRITWADCNFEKEEITVRGDPETGTKNWNIRRVPMITEMRKLLEKLRSAHPDELPTAPVMRVRECQKSMDRAARIVSFARITHHDLRPEWRLDNA